MTTKPETQSQVEPRDASFWLSEIEAAKERMADWYEKAEDAEDRYRDEDERPFGSLNILWANVETQKAAIGEEFGKPQVTRLNAPENDGGLSRHIAMIWERAIAAAVRDSADNHDISLAVADIFVPGKGQVWLELDPKEDEKGNVTWVSSPLVRVPYKDYLEGPATRWGGVPWTGRRHLFTRDELVKQCGMSEEDAVKVPLNVQLPYEDRKDKPSLTKGKEQFMRAAAWEIWAKFPEKARLYVAEDYDKVLCWDADPYRLKDFFPCPRPMQANGEECKPPLTDYSRYEDQAKELDRICERIFVLTETLKRRGIHDKKFKELQDLALAGDNVSVAVENFAELTKGGGDLHSVQLWEDLTATIQVIAQLVQQRGALIQLIYELSGISDLARGMTDPNETLGAQKLKMSFGAGRFRAREADSRRFAAEAYAIKGELIAEHYPREQLQEMTGIPLPTQAEIDGARRQLQELQNLYATAQQTGMQLPPPNQEQIAYLSELAQTRFSWERISKVLRSEYRRCYSVEVETDQSQLSDEQADKTAATELFSTTIQAMEQIAPLIQGNPKTGDVFKQLFMFTLSRFRVGRGMEEGFERAFDEAIKKAQEPQQQAPADPIQEKTLQQLDLQNQNLTLDIEGKRQKATELSIKATEAQNAAADINLKAIQAKTDAADKAVANALKAQQAKADYELNRLELIKKFELETAKQAWQMNYDTATLAIKKRELDLKEFEAARSVHADHVAASSAAFQDLQPDLVAPGDITDIGEPEPDKFELLAQAIRDQGSAFHAAMTAPRHLVRDGEDKVVGMVIGNGAAPPPSMEAQ